MIRDLHKLTMGHLVETNCIVFRRAHILAARRHARFGMKSVTLYSLTEVLFNEMEIIQLRAILDWHYRVFKDRLLRILCFLLNWAGMTSNQALLYMLYVILFGIHTWNKQEKRNVKHKQLLYK